MAPAIKKVFRFRRNKGLVARTEHIAVIIIIIIILLLFLLLIIIIIIIFILVPYLGSIYVACASFQAAEPITTEWLDCVSGNDEKKKKKKRKHQSINSLLIAHQCTFVHSQSRKTAGQMVRTTCAETPWWRRCFNRGTRLSSTQKPLRTNVSGRIHQTPLSAMRTVPDIQPFSVGHHLARLSSSK